MAKIDRPLQPIPHHIPYHVRKKMKPKPLPRYFEVDPSSGSLSPGDTEDIRIRFMPSEAVRMLYSCVAG